MPGETLDHLDEIAWYHFDTYVEFVDQVIEARRAQQGDEAGAVPVGGGAGSESDPIPETLENSPFAGVWDDNVVYLPRPEAS